jgi:hypothetical protein
VKNLNSYLATLNLNVAATVVFVETLSDAERVELRKELERIGCQKIVRNLYFNYVTQKWIESN